MCLWLANLSVLSGQFPKFRGWPLNTGSTLFTLVWAEARGGAALKTTFFAFCINLRDRFTSEIQRNFLRRLLFPKLASFAHTGSTCNSLDFYAHPAIFKAVSQAVCTFGLVRQLNNWLRWFSTQEPPWRIYLLHNFVEVIHFELIMKIAFKKINRNIGYYEHG